MVLVGPPHLLEAVGQKLVPFEGSVSASHGDDTGLFGHQIQPTVARCAQQLEWPTLLQLSKNFLNVSKAALCNLHITESVIHQSNGPTVYSPLRQKLAAQRKEAGVHRQKKR